MGIGFANLGASANPDINNGANQTAYSGTSWTPPNNGLIVAFVVSYIAAIGNVPTMQGNNINWVQIATVAVDPGTSHRTTLFGGIPTGSITGITGVDFAAQVQLSANVSFFHVTGSVHLADGVTGSVVQTQTGNGTATSGTVTLNAAANSNNLPIVCFAHQANEVTTPNPAWTEADDNAGTGPNRGVETQWKSDVFSTLASANWVTSAAWIGMAAEVKAQAQGAQSYEDSVSVSRKESVSDRMANNVFPLALISQKDGISDGMNNSIPKDSSMNKVLTLTDSKFVGVFPTLTLLQILATTSANFATMQGSVGLSGNLGIGGSPNTNSNSNASLLNRMGVNLSGGLNLLFNLTIAEKMGFSVFGNVGVYPSLTLGRDLAFVPANIALIGGSVSLGQALGLIDVPNLNAQASLSFLGRLGINLTSALASQTVEAVLALAERLGLSDAAQLNIFPLVGLGERLFLLDANNANMFGGNVLNEIRGVNIAGGLSLQGNVAIPIDLNILTNKLIAVFKDLTVQDRLGISDSVLANMQASVSLGETAGMGNAVNQILNAGLSINVIGSVLTISGLNVIIVKGFVFTSDSAKNSLSTSNYSSNALGSDSANSVETGDS